MRITESFETIKPFRKTVEVLDEYYAGEDCTEEIRQFLDDEEDFEDFNYFVLDDEIVIVAEGWDTIIDRKTIAEFAAEAIEYAKNNMGN